MTAVKICGITRLEDVAAVNEAKPDYIGFVFAKSRRQVTKAQAKQLKQALLPEIKAIGVFVNAPLSEVIGLVEEGCIDGIQLHGQETETYIAVLQKEVSVPIMKAVSVATKEDVAAWQQTKAEYLLFDTGAGGTGKTFDWSLLEENQKQYFLAGGLSLENLPQALALYPYGVDLSSGAETEGYKDRKKILDIVALVRQSVERSV